MTRSFAPKIALLASLLMLCLPLLATPATDSAPDLLQAPPAPLCDASKPSPQDAGWMEIAELVQKTQCTYDKQCVEVCPCLPQCVDGYCANCLWCPPDS